MNAGSRGRVWCELMDGQLERDIAALTADRRSGASEILLRVLSVLREVQRQGAADLAQVGRGLCRAQPSMASVWNAVGIALRGPEAEAALARFERRVLRAPEALARFAAEAVLTGVEERGGDPLRVTTCSRSRSVLVCLKALATRRPLRVACAEGRPVFEGRDMARALVDAGLPVDFFTDAGPGVALDGTEAVIVGADAVASSWVINKCGTRQLAAAAVSLGIPVHVVASRDKFVAPALEKLLVLRGGPAEEVWEEAPPAVAVCNPYFEQVPMDLLTSIISDVGVLGPDMVAEACEGASREINVAALATLVG